MKKILYVNVLCVAIAMLLSGCMAIGNSKNNGAISYMNQKYGEIFLIADNDEIVVASTAPQDASVSSAIMPDEFSGNEDIIYLQPTQHPKWRVSVIYDKETETYHDNYIRFLLAARTANKMSNSIETLFPEQRTIYVIDQHPVDDTVNKESMTQDILMTIPLTADIYTNQSSDNKAEDEERLKSVIDLNYLNVTYNIHYLDNNAYVEGVRSGFIYYYDARERYYTSNYITQGIKSEFNIAAVPTAEDNTDHSVAVAELRRETQPTTEALPATLPVETTEETAEMTETETEIFAMDRTTEATTPAESTSKATTAPPTPAGTQVLESVDPNLTAGATTKARTVSGGNIVITSPVFYDSDTNHTPDPTIERDGITYQLVDYKYVYVSGTKSSKPIEKSVTYNNVDASFSPPETTTTDIVDEQTGERKTVTLNLVTTEASGSESNVVFRFTLTATSYGSDEYTIGTQTIKMTDVDPFTPIEDYLLGYFGYDPSQYRMANVHWVGEPRSEGDATLRDAAGDIVKGNNSVTALYRANVSTSTKGGHAIEAVYKPVQ